jgi:hypothetical protein
VENVADLSDWAPAPQAVCTTLLFRRDEDRDDSLESPAKRMRLSTEEEEEAGPCDSADGASPLMVIEVFLFLFKLKSTSKTSDDYAYTHVSLTKELSERLQKDTIKKLTGNSELPVF